MCGLAGFINYQRINFSVDESLLCRMQQRLVHRGPDSKGLWKSDQDGIGLAHQRLTIVDLSDAGNQPMVDASQRAIICFNGEIYNHRQLRAELRQRGYRYRSQTDTETILNAYLEWGIKSLDHLDGMFAFALYDFSTRELYLVRDRMGIKPLYFSVQGGVLSFASEIKALWELPWMKKERSEFATYHYLTFMVVPAPFTIFDGIYKLPAGFYAKLDANKHLTFHEWYTPLAAPREHEKNLGDEQYCITRVQDLFEESVKKRMMADVPVGAFLSGGIDSSLNVAMMSQMTGKVKTFTVAFSDGPEINELVWARKVAKHFGTDHHEIVISEKEAYEFFETMVYHHDEPLADCVSIPLYFVAKLAKDCGVTVVQIGEGADELFFGYQMYASYKKFHDRFFAPTQKLMPALVRKGLAGMARCCLPNNFNLQEVLGNWAYGRSLFWSGAIAFNERQKQVVFAQKYKNLDTVVGDPIAEKIMPGLAHAYDSHTFVDYHLKNLKSSDDHADFGKEMLYLELKHRLPELLLMRADKMTMAVGVEGRVPFLDYKLVEFLLQVPDCLKFKNNVSKYLLKKACYGILPHEIIERKKVGFGAPIVRWFKRGKRFPAYFEKLCTNKTSDFFDPFIMKNGLRRFNHHDECFAVQQWVLQNFLACPMHDAG